MGFDVSVLRHGASAGTALYAFNLARALLRSPECGRLVLHTAAREDAEGRAALERLGEEGAEVVRGPAPDRWSPDAAWWLPLPRRLPARMRELDVFHLGEFYFPDPGSVPAVATVHDLTDLMFPELHTPLNRWMHRRRRAWIQRHARRVIAVSHATRDDLLRHVDLPPERVTTVHEARAHAEAPEPGEREQDATLERLGVGRNRYILFVSTLEPRKNHIRLVRAFDALPDRHGDVRLVLVGATGWRAGSILRAVRNADAADRIVRSGFVDAAALRALYRRATLFAYPSLYEGFGLPLLEAMAAGLPVLTSDRSSMPEVAGDAALLVDPESVDAIARGLTRLLDNDQLRRGLAEAGRRREAEFSWDRAAAATIDVYRSAMRDAA